jgi:hypothetical protein
MKEIMIDNKNLIKDFIFEVLFHLVFFIIIIEPELKLSIDSEIPNSSKLN